MSNVLIKNPVITTGGGDFINKTVEIDHNGSTTYYASSDGAEGYESITTTVNATPRLTTKQISSNNTYYASEDNCDGYSEVGIQVAPELSTLERTINTNGGFSYSSSQAPYSAYDVVILNIQPQPQVSLYNDCVYNSDETKILSIANTTSTTGTSINPKSSTTHICAYACANKPYQIGNERGVYGIYASSSNLTTIEEYAFYQAKIIEFQFPSTLSSIGDYALAEIDYSASYRTSGEELYISFAGTMDQWNNITFGNHWHDNVPLYVSCSDGTIHVPI